MRSLWLDVPRARRAITVIRDAIGLRECCKSLVTYSSRTTQHGPEISGMLFQFLIVFAPINPVKDNGVAVKCSKSKPEQGKCLLHLLNASSANGCLRHRTKQLLSFKRPIVYNAFSLTHTVPERCFPSVLLLQSGCKSFVRFVPLKIADHCCQAIAFHEVVGAMLVT
ncbi:hypothetical protein SAMN04515695_2364 [Pseudovibrio sp. Tun.PSC04-5.I4]|nr:hypothetical protein SAMN04515695_2364 [Pseudovibrio sp. Tun.PSC04-5.I4]